MDSNPAILVGRDLKGFCQPHRHKPFVVSLEKADPSSLPQRVCAWCNTVMREGTKPATHGMCPKCLEEQMHSLEEQEAASGSEVPVRQTFSQGAHPGSWER